MKHFNKRRALSLLASTIILATATTSAAPTLGGYDSLYNVYAEELVQETGANSYETENLAYTPYYSNIIDSSISIPIVNSMVPQGICVTEDCYLISSYDYSKQEKSTISIIDYNGNLLNTCSLDSNAHVGGISYDCQNNLVWVSDNNGTVSAYRLEALKNKPSATPIYRSLNVGEGLPSYTDPNINAVSYLSIYKDHLFVGNFTTNGPGLVKEYSITIDENKVVHLAMENSFKVPNKVQGLTFYEKNNKTYLILSRSSGRKNSSLLQIFNYDSTIKDYSSNNIKSAAYLAPAMMEQATAYGKNLYTVYESGASPYNSQAKDVVDSLYISDIDNMVEELNSRSL